jgi:hypothetical protein
MLLACRCQNLMSMNFVFPIGGTETHATRVIKECFS